MRKIGLGVLALALLGVIGIGIAYAMTDVPKPNERATQQASVLYYSDGKTVLDRVAVLDGGLPAWAAEGRPTGAHAAPPAADGHTGRAHPSAPARSGASSA